MLKSPIHHHIFSIAHRKNGGYDIPLHTRLGTEFLVLLIALMTYLLLLSATGSIGLGHMADKWVSGLENAMTIEIPASETAKDKSQSLLAQLQKLDGVKSAKILSQQDMGDMLSPWLGNDTSVLADLPLPVLVSIELKKRTPALTTAIKNTVNTYTPDAVVDSHEAWLVDLLKLTNGLRFTAMIVFGLILFVTSLVIAGAVRSRMAMHQRELELLHTMGATDRYISLQFIRYIFSQTTKGLGFGLIAGALTFAGFFIFTNQTTGTLPELNMGRTDFIFLLLIPILLLVIGSLTARQTVYSVLNEMP
jgi:cell division transport system permease protein